jgi:hypothetical protein
MVGERREDPKPKAFHWNYSEDGNVDHIARHTVQPEDVEEVAANVPRFFAPRDPGRDGFVMVGPNLTGRYLLVAIIETPEGDWYPVTAHWLDRRRGERNYNS